MQRPKDAIQITCGANLQTGSHMTLGRADLLSSACAGRRVWWEAHSQRGTRIYGRSLYRRPKALSPRGGIGLRDETKQCRVLDSKRDMYRQR